MLFNSYVFIFAFLPITFFIYFYLNKKRLVHASNGFLVASSLFFYSWWNVLYLPLILISMVINYSIGSELTKDKKRHRIPRKFILGFSITANLALLGYFKYVDFFIENINFISGSDLNLLNLALPLAISFFTFQQIAYLVDSYKGETREYDFINYAIFVTFFPQLIAGPIVHHKEMMPQFKKSRNRFINHRNISLGLLIFSIGIFKKVAIADTFAVWATAGFDKVETLYFFEAWATSLSYTFQLYFDFSGYADMAIGAALLFNIRLPINFNSPYKSLNIQDFWRRWHITLSRFLRDYIYIPLGGSKVKNYKVHTNLMITFLIGGIWHGAGWTFVFWGFLHGLALVIHRFWIALGFKLNGFFAWFITFNFVNFAWIFFRAETFSGALKVLRGMLFLNGVSLPRFLEHRLGEINQFSVQYGDFLRDINGSNKTLFWLAMAMLIVLAFKNSSEISQDFKPTKKWLAITFAFLLFSVISLNEPTEFLYFNF